jgi:NADH-quinone oxidoreductase subunit K
MENTIQSVPQNWYLWLSALLFCIGVSGVLMRRNAIIILMCIELMLNSGSLLLVAFSAYSDNSDGQVFVFFIMVVAAAEVAVGLALLMSIYRSVASTDIDVLSKLKL